MKTIKNYAAALIVISAAIGMMGCKPEAPHVHTFKTDWTTNPEYHWHEASCEHTDEVSEKNVHTWDNEDYQYDSTSKKEKRTCTVCDYVDEKEHVHTESSGAITKEATITSVGEIAYKCSGCNEELKKELFCGPLGTDGNAATSSSKYVYFGVFPKTIKVSTVKVDETVSVKMGGNTYYKGDDGEWYAKVTANPKESSYTYSDSTTIISGNTDYFKVEPIKWRVLTTDFNETKKALLLAEDSLTACVYFSTKENRSVNSKIIFPNNYQYSTVRAYLNGKYESGDTQTATYNNAGFLQTAFTTSAQDLIAETKVINDGASTSDAAGNVRKADGSSSSNPTDYTCDDTIDKIFLLSQQEVTTKAYGFSRPTDSLDGNPRIHVATDYARANKAHQQQTEGNGGWWWLRSPFYCFNEGVGIVNQLGICGEDAYVSNNNESAGIVPAITISF